MDYINKPTTLRYKLLKLFRFYKVYGFERTYIKAVGRLRRKTWLKLPIIFRRSNKNVGLIGCGQFAFGTITYFLKKTKGNVLKGCYDINPSNANSLATYYSINVKDSIESLVNDNTISLVYIASNHASHTDYAINCMLNGKMVYIEKPVSTSLQQFYRLIKTKRETNQEIFAGYNRPFSQAIKIVNSYIDQNDNAPMTLNCFVIGHNIPKDHWYRNPDEGTRVCGNIGHWIDLTIHLLSARSLPQHLSISISYSNKNEPDDNLSITITSEFGDLISITLSSRSEPFEGIYETICFQHKATSCVIDDFRKITVWNNSELLKKKFFPKDVGHKNAILQPYLRHEQKRDFKEIEISTLLMLHIMEMVLEQREKDIFNPMLQIEALNREINKLS